MTQTKRHIVTNTHGVGIVATVLAPDAGATTAPIKKKEDASGGVYEWGPNNEGPAVWAQKIEKSTTALPLLFKYVKTIYGKGLRYYIRETDANGNELKNYSSIQEVDDFLQNNDIDEFLIKRIVDFKWWNNVWCEFILNKLKSKVVNINHLESSYCRFLKEKEGEDSISFVGYGAYWPDKKGKDDIPFIHSSEISTKSIKALPEKKFCSHHAFPVPNRTLYSVPSHYALFQDDSWLDYTNSIPIIMNSINKNVMDIRWHIQIPYEYWPSIYPDWVNVSQQERDSRINAKLTEMNDFLMGTKNAGKAFISHFATDEITGKPLAGWIIEPLEDKDKKDKFLTSNQEGDIQIARALDIDTSLANIQPANGSMGAGSGSDKRTAFTNSISLTPADLVYILKPLYIVARINKWASNLVFTIEYEVPTTLNENKAGSKTVTQ